MSVFLDTGVRVRELCDIKVDDVRLADRQILIAGKSGEQRLVPIQTQTIRILKRYIAARGDSYVDWLFITVDDEQMNRDSVRRRIEKYGRQAGITNVRCSPHTFRHTFAKMSVQNGADLFTLQKILGQKRLIWSVATSICLVRIPSGRMSGSARWKTCAYVFSDKNKPSADNPAKGFFIH